MVFDESCWLDLVSYNSMIDGYVKNGEIGAARKVFNEMPDRDVLSWNCLIAGYVGVGDLDAASFCNPFSFIINLTCSTSSHLP